MFSSHKIIYHNDIFFSVNVKLKPSNGTFSYRFLFKENVCMLETIKIIFLNPVSRKHSKFLQRKRRLLNSYLRIFWAGYSCWKLKMCMKRIPLNPYKRANIYPFGWRAFWNFTSERTHNENSLNKRYFMGYVYFEEIGIQGVRFIIYSNEIYNHKIFNL